MMKCKTCQEQVGQDLKTFQVCIECIIKYYENANVQK